MELCRYFHAHRPRRTMEFIWFGAEEKGLLGSQNYIKIHENELSAHRFNMNVDLAGQLVGGTVAGSLVMRLSAVYSHIWLMKSVSECQRRTRYGEVIPMLLHGKESLQ